MNRISAWRRLRVTVASLSVVLGAVAIAVPSSASSSSGPSFTYQPSHAGGTLKLLASTAGGTLDPQVNYTLQYWQLYQATYDGLLAFRKVGGAASFDVVPDLATAMPTITNGGKTYTFTLRKGVKFSNGQTVTVKDVQASLQRLFKVSNPNAGTWYNQIVGATACLAKPATCTLAGGVVVNPATNKVVINLTSPDPEFVDQLAVPFGSILPASAPAKDAGTTPIPGTGAYAFSSYNPNRQLTLVRNKYFKVWSAAAQPQGYPNEIDMIFGNTVESEVTQVENGQANWVFDPLPSDRLSELSTKYASQLHVNPLTAVWYLPMNTNLAPFNNYMAREALNYAIDKNAAVRLFGGSKLAQPVCTILPPGFPGHVNYCDYNKGMGSTYNGPDLAKAKALVKKSGTAGMSVAIVVTNDSVNEAVGQYVQSVLNSIGYKATLKPLSANIQFNYIQNTKNKVQISLSQWYQDYPAASDFLKVLLSCQGFHPGSDNSINIAGYCNKAIDAKMAKAETLSISDPNGANKIWGQIDQQIMGTAAPWVPLFTPKQIDFVSSKTGNYQFSRQFYMYVDQLWVK
ncbi:MAG: ABC transporter substrate-binding protein [Acidobacteriota bacterium]|nr:ABC transporter substrate-binding protein [Acidobacteriota bacterium]MDE3043626.1 ABC transporter substrate-binding protein [Acidobacteriota bacterium]MDE3107392.1 ABC transporter substrate-binding protein [Acidobacteriota bacterium]